MTDAAADPADAAPATPPRKRRLGPILGVVAALALGGGGFYAVWSGIVDPAGLLAGGGHGGGGHGEAAALPADVAFVPMEPIMVSLPPGSSARLLRFAGQLEVEPEHAAEVAAVLPRVVDVLNTFLRAVEPRDLEQPSALAPLRAQMLRRIQVVVRRGAGEGSADHRIRAELREPGMDLLMNGLLTVATLFAGGYCWVLARRVRDLKSLDKGLGGAIVTLTRQIELARATLDEARAGVEGEHPQELAQLVARADAAAGQLRLLLAAAAAGPPAP